MLNSLCWDDDYTIAQWLEHRWLQAKVPGSSPGGDSHFCSDFSCLSLSLKLVKIHAFKLIFVLQSSLLNLNLFDDMCNSFFPHKRLY